MESKYSITLTANASIPVKTGITLVKGDSGQKLYIKVLGIDVSNTTAKISFDRPSGVSVESDISATDGVYYYEIKGNELAVPGVVVADLKFYEGTDRISTASFIFNVTDDTMDGSHTETDVIDKSQIEEWADEAKESAEEAKAYRDQAAAITGVGIATTTTLGLVKPDGTSVTIDSDGTIHSVGGGGGGSSYTLPAATITTLGGVIPDGTTITVDANGKISGATTYTLPEATTSSLGGVKADGTSITVDADGTIHSINGATPYTLPEATASTLGGVKIGSGVNVTSDGTISVDSYTLPTASTTTLGGVKVDGTSITITNGVISAAGGGGSGFAPKDVSDLFIANGNGKVTICWSDPEDSVVEGVTLSVWKGTKLVQKSGSYPIDVNDGTLVCDNQTRDAYKTNGFVISGLTNGQTYYFSLFPYSDTNAVNKNETNRVSGTPVAYRTMTAVIDLSNSNPATCVTYEDDAVGMTAGSSDWDTFFGHYPCLFKDGAEVGKLQRNDFDKFEDGSTVDIYSGNAGDVMIAFPRKGLKISTVDNKVYVSMTDDPDNSGFEYNAHTRGTTAKDVFYLGAYKGIVASNKLRSLKGQTITGKNTISQFRTYAQANGSGYEQSAFYQLVFRQSMYILKYKNLDSQSTIGTGYVLSSHTATLQTGGTESWGMDCEVIKQTSPTYMTDQNHHVKLFGLEDFWGNIWECIDGFVTDWSWNILTANNSFNDSGSGYTNNGQGANANIAGYMSKPQGTTKTGFVPKEVSGSSSTYFCDRGSLDAGRICTFGGRFSYGLEAGALMINIDNSSSESSVVMGARLMYL